MPRTEFEEHHAAILHVLDERVAIAARARGVEACDGQDGDQPCEIGDIHTATAKLAHAIAEVIEEPFVPTTRMDDLVQRRIHDAVHDFQLAMAKAFMDRPRVS